MTTVDLRLEASDRAQCAATAWLISGADPLRWLAEIAAWELDEQKLTLFILPKSRHDSSPGGVLVTFAGQRVAPARLPAGLAFGAVAEGVYVPVDSALLPALRPAELLRLKTHEVVIFHPALGPIGFGLEAALGVADLLAAPPERAPSWAAAPLDSAPHSRIESITFRATLSVAGIFGDAGDEIGTERPENLPPLEGEGGGPLSRGLQKLRDLIGDGGKKSPAASAYQRMQQWISANVQGAARDLALSRGKALMRLLDQLRNNPDEGLKRALPLGGSGMHRGIAPPAGDLGSRNADFSLDRLRGGGAADFWHLPPDLFQELRAEYLALAERERQLGRFRRAAYIHAELLGDMLGAARVLAEGGFWREAALLHRDHLRQPLEAAKCFVRARMIPEAVELYEKENAYAPLAELYERLGEQEKAQRTWRRWTTQLITERNLGKAADILVEKLGARDEALALLESAWPDHPDAHRCIDGCFLLRAAAGEHDEAARLVGRLAEKAGSVPRRRLQLLHVYSALQANYPDRAVRAVAENLGREQVAHCLRLGGDASVRRDALQLLPRLAPDDRLLARDAQRFADLQRPKSAPAPAGKLLADAVIPVGTHPANLVLLREFRLPASRAQWMKAAATAHGFAVIGTGRHGVELTRCTFEGESQTVRWHGSELPDQTIPDFLLCTIPQERERIVVAAANGPLLSEHELPETDAFAAARAGAPSWLTGPVAALAAGADRSLWAMRAVPTGALISGFREGGQVAVNFPAPPLTLITRPKDTAPRMPLIHLAVCGQEVLCAVGNELHRCVVSGGAPPPPPLMTFDEEITGLEASPAWGTPHVAVLLETRIAICWLGIHRGRVHVLNAETEGALAGFTSDATLVALTHEDGFLFDSDSRGRLRSARFGWRGAAPLAVLRGPVARTFTVIDVNGLVRVFGFSADELK